MRQRSFADATVGQEVVASHLRSLMATHLTDVPSSDHHTVKPWFNGKLDFSPIVADFGDRGFVLAGGRLDYLGNRPVAALVYRRRQHVINLFTWPTSQPDLAIGAFDQQGYHAFHWTRSHVTYWAASDLNLEELRPEGLQFRCKRTRRTGLAGLVIFSPPRSTHVCSAAGAYPENTSDPSVSSLRSISHSQEI